jgi:hypothetical protein
LKLQGAHGQRQQGEHAHGPEVEEFESRFSLCQTQRDGHPKRYGAELQGYSTAQEVMERNAEVFADVQRDFHGYSDRRRDAQDPPFQAGLPSGVVKAA